ncbi:MAG: 30S ribosomal protein S3ae, partial [Nitrososphaerota archaeon]
AGESRVPKESYDIYAPPYFGGRWLGSTIASDPAKLVGRVLRTSLYALTDDFSKQYLLLNFRIINVSGKRCETVFYGHQYGREFLRSLVKRGTNKIDMIFDVTTADGFVMRLTSIAFTVSKISLKKRRAIRALMKKILTDTASKLTHDQLAQEMVLGKTASDIYNEIKKIVLPRHVGIVKSKILKLGDLSRALVVEAQLG